MLKTIYKKFLRFYKAGFATDLRNFSTSLSNIEVPDGVINQFFENYEKPTFFYFLKKIKDIIYSLDEHRFIMENFTDQWEFSRYLMFLTKERLVEIRKNKILKIHPILKNNIVKPLPEDQIRKIIERKLHEKIENEAPAFRIFRRYVSFSPDIRFDQFPITQGSAIFLVKKILDYLPLKKKFLIAGDDDFISIFLTLVYPEIECIVCELDRKLIDSLSSLAKRYRLRISFKEVDILSKKRIKERFVGFLTNPIYTFDGIKKFVHFCKAQLGEDGGFGFLVMGDESVGNRLIFLQEFFVKEKLLLLEMINGKIHYPFYPLYREDNELIRRFSLFFDADRIKKIPSIGASLLIFNYLHVLPQKIKFHKSPYAYL